MKCPRRYYYRFGAKLVPKVVGVPLRIGRAVHVFMEVWGQHTNGEASPVEHRFSEALNAAIVDLAESKPPNIAINQIEEEITKSMTRLIQGYVRKYGAMDEFSILEPEVEETVPILGGHEFRFRTDAPIHFQNQLWLVEHKTTVKPIREVINDYVFNHQVIGLKYGIGKATGQNVTGVIVNILQRETRKNFPDYHREYIVVSPGQVEETVLTLSMVAADIESRDLSRKTDWPMYTTFCKYCDYRNVCFYGQPAEEGAIYRIDHRYDTVPGAEQPHEEKHPMPSEEII